MNCPKCGAAMQKADKADVYLCLSCGARARLVVDEADAPVPWPTVIPVPYNPQPYTPPLSPVWYGPSTAEPPPPIRWFTTCNTASS